jgi:hypothetical protein
MSQQKIELSGIVRNLPDNTVKDGTMHELINLRPKDGALRPVGAKTAAIYSTPDVRFIHKVSETIKVLIGVDSSNALLYAVYVNGIFIQSVHEFSITADLDMSFASLKNSLILTNNVTEEITLLIFNEDTNYYSIFHDNFLPNDMPNLQIQRLAVPGDDEAGDLFEVGPDVDPGEVELSQYVKMQKDKGDDGYLSGKVLVRFAWELFDGTMVKHTLPDLISTSEITTTSAFGATYLGGTSPGWRITTTFLAQALQFRFSTLTVGWLTAFQSKYQHVIRSLKIYVSMPKSPELVDTKEIRRPYSVKETTMLGSRIIQQMLVYDVSKLKNYSPDPAAEQYFLLKEYKLSELTANTWTTVDNDSVNDLTTREQMTVDNFSHHQIFAKRLFSYNERIFLGEIKNNLYSGFILDGLLSNSSPNVSGALYHVGVEFDIAVDNNRTLTVFTGWAPWNSYSDTTTINFGLSFPTGSFESYWGYPDSRAFKARVYVRLGTSIMLSTTVNLQSVPSMNFSIAKGINVILPTMSTTTTLHTPKTTYWDYNRIQATELNNPFYYPAINSYRVGLGSILGMSSNAIALSTGQFGQFPIYVFTSDGIWTMSIGTGENLINSVTPLSRLVCNNPVSITPIDGGTAFTSTKGLWIISGASPIEISQIAEGAYLGHMPSNVYADIVENPATSFLAMFFCRVTFLTYIQAAKIAWDYINREIIVSNSAYQYSWVFNVDNKMWFKMGQVFTSFVYDFPACYGLNTNNPTYKYDINNEDFTDLTMVYAETRPLKLSSVSLKKLNRLLLQGYVNNSSPYQTGLYMAGTIDGKIWFNLNNNSNFNAGDIMCIGRSQTSCRSFIFAFGGRVDQEAYFNSIDVDIEERYANKLR